MHNEDEDNALEVSVRSTADYVCYFIQEQFSAVALVIETKKKFSLNALAQLLGYYYRMSTDILKPDMAILLTPTTAYVVIFPFSLEDCGSVANAVCLKGMKLTDMESVLKVLALITSQESYCNPVKIPLPDRFLPIRKRFELIIKTDEDRKVEMLEEKLSQLEKENKEHKKTIAELRCRYVPVNVSIPMKS